MTDEMPTLGPDFLTDDHVEAIQTYEEQVLGLSAAERGTTSISSSNRSASRPGSRTTA